MNDTHDLTEAEQTSADADRELMNAVIRMDERIMSTSMGADGMTTIAEWDAEIHPLVEQVVQTRAAVISETFESIRSGVAELETVTELTTDLVELEAVRFDR